MELTKQELREKMLSRRGALDGEERKRLSERIVERYCGLDYYRTAEQILVYCSVRGELETEDLIRNAFRDGKQVAVPRIRAGGPEGQAPGSPTRSREMEFVEIGPNTVYREGAYQIPEPAEGKIWSSDTWKGGMVELILPGLCFDLYGARIGYGAGYYDRYLKKTGGILLHKTVLAFDFQLFDRIPCEESDEPFDCLVTEKRYYVL